MSRLPSLLRLSSLAVLVLGATSCTGVLPRLSVLQGNYAYGRGSYQQATVQYLDARELGASPDRLSYNLANVYHSLGEIEAALSGWRSAEETDDPEILFRVRFNRGVLYYELGRFRDAYLEFREALRIEPSSVEAKINLELAFEKLAAADNRSLTRRPGSASGEAGADAAQVFEFIRRTGGQQWIPNETVPADNDVDDW